MNMGSREAWAAALLGGVLTGLLTVPSAAQTSCTQETRASVLAQFSDSAPNASITPSNVRNGWCSTQFILDGGADAQLQAPSTSPFLFTAGKAGSLQVDQGKIEVSRNNGVTFYIVSLSGGSFPVLFGDQIKITWFTTTVPTAVFYPAED